MEFLVHHFGIGFLYLAASAILLGVLAGFLKHGGMIYELVCSFLRAVCGA